MDLMQFQAAEGADLIIEHPVTGKPIGDIDQKTGALVKVLKIKLAGKDSDVHKAQSRKMLNRRLNNQKTRRNSAMTVEELEEEGLGMLVACTLGWENVELEGKELPFSAENARMVYTKFPWIREQVDAFIGERENFFKT